MIARGSDKAFNMLDTLRNFLAGLAIGGKPSEHFDENDYRLAAAALLIHVITIDGTVSESERRKLHELLQARFALDDAATEELIEAATAADQDAIDLYRFTSVINRSVDEPGRQRIIEMMWELVYADGRVTEFEDNVIWRAADLLGVSSQARIALRNRVSQEHGEAGNE